MPRITSPADQAAAPRTGGIRLETGVCRFYAVSLRTNPSHVIHGDLDYAERVLRSQADAGDWTAAERLAGLLADRGDLDQAEQLLRAQADAGNGDTGC